MSVDGREIVSLSNYLRFQNTPWPASRESTFQISVFQQQSYGISYLLDCIYRHFRWIEAILMRYLTTELSVWVLMMGCISRIGDPNAIGLNSSITIDLLWLSWASSATTLGSTTSSRMLLLSVFTDNWRRCSKQILMNYFATMMCPSGVICWLTEWYNDKTTTGANTLSWHNGVECSRRCKTVSMVLLVMT